MNRVRYFAVVVLTAAVLVLALQNLHGVTVDVLWWHFTTSVSIITLGPFLAGLLVGLVSAMLVARRSKGGAARRTPPPTAAPAAGDPG